MKEARQVRQGKRRRQSGLPERFQRRKPELPRSGKERETGEGSTTDPPRKAETAVRTSGAFSAEEAGAAAERKTGEERK